MASRSRRQRIQQAEEASHQRPSGRGTQATRQAQRPTTAPLPELVTHSPRTAQLRRLRELANHSPQVSQLRRLQELAISSPQTTQLRRLQELANNGPQVSQLRQLQAVAKEAAPSAAAGISTTKPQAAASQPNLTGLPNQLKSNLEALSGLSMDAVRVHYNSTKPAQLHALAYAQGTNIHLGPGQERHLPHEAWHVVQQAQGRVRPTLQMAGGLAVNDDAGLEREADVMGGRAMQGDRLSLHKPEALRTLPAREVAQFFQDYYAWGAPNTTPHVHVYNGGMHLKTAGGDRYNIVAAGERHAQAVVALEQVRGKGNKKLRQTIKHTAEKKFGIIL